MPAKPPPVIPEWAKSIPSWVVKLIADWDRFGLPSFFKALRQAQKAMEEEEAEKNKPPEAS